MSHTTKTWPGRFWCGIAALGLWLGWTASSLGALSARADAHTSAGIAARLAAHGIVADASTAYLIPDGACACGTAAARADARTLAAALAGLAIPLVDLHPADAPVSRSSTVALFDAERVLRYAGPPRLSLGCLPGEIPSSDTLARLLDGEPLLIPSASCPC